MNTRSSRVALRVEALDDSERAWLTSLLDTLGDAGLTRGVAALSEYFDLERIWSATDPGSANVTWIVTAVGAALGQALVDESRMEWVMTTDRGHTEMAVATPDRRVVVYPLVAVERCWTRDTDVSIVDYVDAVTARVLASG